MKRGRYEWVTRDGEVLTPEEMETSHILNVLNMLARRAQTLIGQRAMLYSLAGDADTARNLARMALSDEALRDWCLSHYPIASALEDVLLSRTRAHIHWGAEY